MIRQKLGVSALRLPTYGIMIRATLQQRRTNSPSKDNVRKNHQKPEENSLSMTFIPGVPTTFGQEFSIKPQKVRNGKKIVKVGLQSS